MLDDLGPRLLRAGLVTRDQLAETLAATPLHGGALIAALVARGVPEEALAGFFLAEGFGPLMDAGDLAKADPGAVRRLPPEMAAGLLALPIRSSPAGLVVAMAAPSDRHAVREIARTVGSEVLATVACVTPLRAALRMAHPDARLSIDAPDSLPESEPPVLELVRRRAPEARPQAQPIEGAWAGSTRTGERGPEKRTLGPGPVLIAPDDDVAVPLVRTKPQMTPARGVQVPSKLGPRVVTKSFARPEGTAKKLAAAPIAAEDSADRKPTAEYQLPKAPSAAEEAYAAAIASPEAPASDSAPAQQPAATVTPSPVAPSPAPVAPSAAAPSPTPVAPSPVTAARAPASAPRGASIIPPEHDSWTLAAPVPPPASSPRSGKLSLRASAELPVTKHAPPEIGTILAQMRNASERDDVVRLACEGAITVARSGIFLALRKGVLKGWDGAGGGLTRDAVRNLWIPTTSPSMFKKVVETGEPYIGPYGTAVADGLFRAAVASRGGSVGIHAVEVGDKVVGVLAVDELSSGSLSKHRIEILAHAIADAFKRVITGRKT